jgi:hypothetical protein
MVTILLDNLENQNYFGGIGNYFDYIVENRLLAFKSWTGNKRDVGDKGTFDLGYIIWDNYDSCSGKKITLINNISFPLNINDDSKNKFNLAMDYLTDKCSAQNKKCKDFGACLIASSKISVSKSTEKSINQLSIGDKILTYDVEMKKQRQTIITGIDSVFHDNLVELYFPNDTIVCTIDHPFYIQSKGWSSLSPTKTINNYHNYLNIKLIEIGDIFVQKKDGKITSEKLSGISYKQRESRQMTYTITSLKNGNTYFVNGILTGVEQLKK